METRILNYFLAIAKLGTISAAARELHVSQPTLSRQIQQLEEQLNTSLFIRERRRMVLTKAGQAYAEKVQRIVTELDQANQLVATINNKELTGTIHLGCVESRVTKLVTPQLAKFHQRYPSVRFEIYDADGDEIKERLDQGLLELGIVSTPISTAKYHTVQLPVEDEWGLLVAADNHLADRQSITVADLRNIPLIIPHRSLIHDDLREWLKMDQEELKIVAEANLLTNASYMVGAGIGNLVCIAGAPQPRSTNLKFIPFKPGHRQKQFLIWKKGVSLSKPASKLVDQLKQLASEREAAF